LYNHEEREEHEASHGLFFVTIVAFVV
jgi:hypothetical protein